MAKEFGFTKIGENLNFSVENVLAPRQALSDEKIVRRFIKLAKKIKRIAPKAEDFLYGHAIMMHAAEACLINQETGSPLLSKSGEPVKGFFEDIRVNGQDSIKWVSPDDIKPYKNANGDIFGESELLKAYKQWIGKPLCKDHKSDSVDGIRGIIVDTYYDPKFKRVHALFALDRKNYGDLARKVETGYANSVSMGTGVGRSICTECHNVAMTEKDYCQCIRSRSNYGEINLDLSPIELSLVVNGADGAAKIRQIVASVNEYVQTKQKRIDEMKNDRCVNPTELQALADSISDMQKKMAALMPKQGKMDEGQYLAALNRLREEEDEETKAMLQQMVDEYESEHGSQEQEAPQAERATMGGGSEYTTPEWMKPSETDTLGIDPSRRLATNRCKTRTEEGKQGALNYELRLLRSKLNGMENILKELKSIYVEDDHMNSARLKARMRTRNAYWQGGGGVNEPTPGKPKYEKEDSDSIRDKEDKQMVGEPLETGSEGLHPGDLEVKKKMLRAEELEGRRIKRQALLDSLSSDGDTLEERQLQRRAYWQGGGGINEPAPGKEKYTKEDSDSIRDKEDKQMVGTPLETGKDGLHPGDLEVKKKWLRARLKAQFTKVADEHGNVVKGACRWDVKAGEDLILTATASEIYDDEVEQNWDYLSSMQYGKDVIKSIRSEGFDRTAWLLKGAADPVAPAAPAMPAMPEAGAELDLGGAMPDAAAPVAEEGEGGDVEVKQEKSETESKVEAALNTMEEKIAEVRELVGGMDSEELVDIDVNVEPKDDDAAPEAPAASPMEGALAARKELMTVEALMDLSADELAEVSETLSNFDELSEESHEKVLQAANAALTDSNTILSQVEGLLKAAKKDDKDDKKDKKDKKEDKEKEDKKDKKDDKDKDDDKDKKEAQKLLDDALKVRSQNRADLVARALNPDQTADLKEAEKDLASGDTEGALHEIGEVMSADDAFLDMLADDGDDDEKKDKKDEKEDKEKEDKDDKEDKKDKKDDDKEDDAIDAMFSEDGVVESTESVFAARKSARDDLLKRAGDILGKYELGLDKAQNATEKTYFQAHPGGKGTTTELTDTKCDGAHVETISEIHDVMRDVAESGPRNVREAAAILQEQIVKGAMTAEDIDQLVAEGKVDAAAASYWKKYFGMAPDSGGFGADMSKEFASKKKEADIKEFKMKLRRAYDIALEAQEKGMISLTKEALDKHVDDIMVFDPAAFESYKRVVSNARSTKKTSGSVPHVGVEGDQKPIEVTATVNTGNVAWSDALSNLGWGSGGR